MRLIDDILEVKYYIIIFVFLFCAILIFFFIKREHQIVACGVINAEYIWGRDFSVCAKPDGSLWRVPK